MTKHRKNVPWRLVKSILHKKKFLELFVTKMLQHMYSMKACICLYTLLHQECMWVFHISAFVSSHPYLVSLPFVEYPPGQSVNLKEIQLQHSEGFCPLHQFHWLTVPRHPTKLASPPHQEQISCLCLKICNAVTNFHNTVTQNT